MAVYASFGSRIKGKLSRKGNGKHGGTQVERKGTRILLDAVTASYKINTGDL